MADKGKLTFKRLQKRAKYLRQREKFIADLVESSRRSTTIGSLETERKRTEEALRESDAHYQALIEQIPVATYIAAIDGVGTTLYFSPQIEEMCGFAPTEWAPNSKLWFEQLHPEDRERVKTELRHSHITGEPFRTEYRMLTRDGNVLWFRDEGTIINDEDGNPLFLQGIMLDITERKRAEEELKLYRSRLEELVEERTAALKKTNEQLQQEVDERRQVEAALRESEQKFRNIVEQSYDGIVLIDEQGIIIEWNGGQEEITGVKRDEVLGRSVWDVQCQVTTEGPIQCDLIAGQMANFNDQIPTKRRSSCLFSALCGASFTAEGAYTHAVAAKGQKDYQFSEQIKLRILETLRIKGKKWHNQLSETEIHLSDGRHRIVQSLVFPIERANGNMAGIISRDITEQKRLQVALIETEKLAALGRMAASLSHEINNPLQSVIGYLGLAREQLSEGKNADECLQIVQEEVRRVARIVGRMRNLYHATSEERQAVQVNALLEQVLKLGRKRCEEGGIAVDWRPSAGLPPLFVATDQIRQVFLNLLLNAIEAMPDGGQLRVETRYIEESAGVDIRFIDSGKGISPDIMSRIFEPFCSTKVDGTGLGLFISRRIVEQHSGRITVESQGEEGATFTVWLPVKNKN